MTAPEPTPYTPSDGSLARALFDADVDATDPEVADRMWSRLAMAHSSWHEQADRLAPWLAAHDARVRAEAVLDYMRTKETPRVEITPLAGPARPGPMTTTTQPEADAASQEDPCAGHYHDAWSPPGSRPDCQPAQPVEPEPDEREALGRLLWLGRGGSLPGAVPWETFPESVKEDWRRCADPILAAGFRRSRPEAS